MSNLITCPSCHTEFAVTEALKAQLSHEIRSQLESELRERQNALSAAQKELQQQRAATQQLQESLQEQIRDGVESHRKAWLAEATKKAEEKLSLQLEERDSELKRLSDKLKESQRFELQLRERERKLEAEKEELKLAAAREVDAQREQIRQQALKQAAEAHELKDAEHQQMVEQLKRQINELKRKAEQGSQQMQGEVQEVALEELLQKLYPTDNIDPVPKGVRGGDALQRVFCSSGVQCGTILWESKRTKNWSSSWLPKLRDDMRASRADCAVIVTEALPEGVESFAQVDGVWVCRWSSVAALAMALRAGLIDLGKYRLAEHGRQEKTQMVYSYLSGKEFQQRVAGAVEAFVAMKDDLDSEKRSMTRIWSKREKQIERAATSMAGLYGDLQGIIGASLPTIEGLAAPRIEFDDPADEEGGARISA